MSLYFEARRGELWNEAGLDGLAMQIRRLPYSDSSRSNLACVCGVTNDDFFVPQALPSAGHVSTPPQRYCYHFMQSSSISFRFTVAATSLTMPICIANGVKMRKKRVVSPELLHFTRFLKGFFKLH